MDDLLYLTDLDEEPSEMGALPAQSYSVDLASAAWALLPQPDNATDLYLETSSREGSFAMNRGYGFLRAAEPAPALCPIATPE
jgi:hypothetical protein